MKNFLFLLVIIFLSCGEKKEQQEDPMQPRRAISEDLQLSGSYFIKRLNNENILSEKIDLTFDEKRKELRGNAGCNRFSAQFERNGNKITFGEPVGTRMFCEGKMEREKQVIEILQNIAEVRENEKNLVFLSSQGEQLLTVEKNNNE